MEKSEARIQAAKAWFDRLKPKNGLAGEVIDSWETYLQAAFERFIASPAYARCLNRIPAAREAIQSCVVNLVQNTVEQAASRLGYVRQEELEALKLRLALLEAEMMRMRVRNEDPLFGIGINC